jgi:hypothetical protein
MRTAIAVLLACVTPAAADTPQSAEVSGFVTYGTGDLAGTVTGSDGSPIRGIKVHIAAGTAKERVVTTDAKGNFGVKLSGGGATYIYVEDKVKITGRLASAVQEGEYEAIEIRETLPPVVAPKSKIGLDVVPEYSELAMDKDVWTRAWLLLDVTETGKVRRVKLINAPGFDLDKIAIREAFKIPFEPARDRVNNAVSALVLWTWEWPAHYWMIQNRKYPNRVPPVATTVNCKGSGPSKAMRDCTKPAVAKAVTLPWIDKPN